MVCLMAAIAAVSRRWSSSVSAASSARIWSLELRSSILNASRPVSVSPMTWRRPSEAARSLVIRASASNRARIRLR